MKPNLNQGQKKRRTTREEVVEHPLGETRNPPPNMEHTPSENLTETDEALENKFMVDQHEIFASEAACTAYLVVLERTYNPSIGKPSGQIYLFAVEALCRAPSNSALVPIAHSLMLQFHPPRITDQFVGALLQREIHLLLAKALSSQDFLKRLFATGQVCLLAQLAIQSESSGSSGRTGKLLSALLPQEGNSPGPSQPTHRWEIERDRLSEQYNAMLMEDRGQSVHKYFSVLLPCI
ncbi:unnamed protein product [Rhizoctonia solani]|uniref:Uncharacterized protein n=1 Tax=Rhizoctonia solani TaxID=456999 RepID=A0A8H2XLQ1_9AGAM|nr:unnamed protein product [Rhizoctonia solani]CAE6429944.1 unnamed protein product [Rhizoctonia solani]